MKGLRIYFNDDLIEQHPNWEDGTSLGEIIEARAKDMKLDVRQLLINFVDHVNKNSIIDIDIYKKQLLIETFLKIDKQNV